MRSGAPRAKSTIHRPYYHYYLDMHPSTALRAAVVVEIDWVADAYRITRSLSDPDGSVLASTTTMLPRALWSAEDVLVLLYGPVEPAEQLV